ncbi:MBL fold metallo-hydrolase [Pseudomonas vancouverensis]|uniref:MBL fold metallo-hydrolase n=1 Tax=Pseudomonas vancouverensis TaxID=95300 RepID=UPI003D0933D8
MRWLVLVLLLLTTACSQDASELPLSDQHDLPPPKIQALGVTGFLLHWRGEGLLFDPFFSRPTLLGMLWMTPDTVEIDKRMPRATDVTMLLVGHAHFDHMLDVAWVARKHAPNAKVYGSSTAGHILRAELPAERLVNAEPKMARLLKTTDARTVAQPDGWFYSTRRSFRAMPIQSNHAPNATGIDLMGGNYDHDLTALPKAFWNWKEGQTTAWLVDVLDEQGRAIYRIHFQDSASDAPYGIPPDLGDHKGVDVEILPVASWSNVRDYPRALLKVTRPRLVILAHWEDFFGGDPDHPRILREQKDEPQMIQITRDNVPQGAVVVMPKPFSEIALPPAQVR